MSARSSWKDRPPLPPGQPVPTLLPRFRLKRRRWRSRQRAGLPHALDSALAIVADAAVVRILLRFQFRAESTRLFPRSAPRCPPSGLQEPARPTLHRRPAPIWNRDRDVGAGTALWAAALPLQLQPLVIPLPLFLKPVLPPERKLPWIRWRASRDVPLLRQQPAPLQPRRLASAVYDREWEARPLFSSVHVRQRAAARAQLLAAEVSVGKPKSANKSSQLGEAPGSVISCIPVFRLFFRRSRRAAGTWTAFFNSLAYSTKSRQRRNAG